MGTELVYSRRSLKLERRAKPATTNNNFKKLLTMILDERRLKKYEVVDAVDISEVRVRYILQEILSMKKICIRVQQFLYFSLLS